ncbi:hypothetical protein B9Q06_04890 [Candidatus Marsarchaeota G2 archaeon ECH_B_2]|uniref:Uncharacterized protein n=3 Tax=Candidatus Marsarchaeota group 2 TaxID=2203771 RepID=A0A2R6BAM2_9ARCH|nr:MAG: hypothetical protein B9Q06_04890 [Candidatus Marsarchaeota G2 archaeon ECH_B_2]PSO00310.1 MAG: hypothetical protein B9Q07_04145 [Candidatus Marsarchaeota G2 archaeon ECH_B_3]PSO02423.1 MAG: hypothetical protein B9Q05_05175 [Candidatus Marsarchaeota G2 archaeon ECH_B_1]
MGTSIIVVSVAFAFLRLLNPPVVNAILTQSLGELVAVIIQVLFLAVMIWGGTILLDRGLRKS